MKNNIFLTSMLAVLITGSATADVVIGPSESKADCKSPDIGQNTTSGSVKYRAKWTANDYEIFLSGGTSNFEKIIETYEAPHWKNASGDYLDPADKVPIPTYPKAVFTGYFAPDDETETGYATNASINAAGEILIPTTEYNDSNTDDDSNNNDMREATLTAIFADCKCDTGTNVDSCVPVGVGTGENENKCYYSYTCADGYHLDVTGATSDDITSNFYGVVATASNPSPNCVANTISLEWDANGGEIDTNGSTTCTYDSLETVTVAQVEERTGYTFNGWEIACSGRVDTYNPATGVCTCLSGYNPILNTDGSITCDVCGTGKTFNPDTQQCE